MSFVAWHSQDEVAPEGAFQAGWEADGTPLYACRITLGSVITPGKTGKTTGRGALYVSDWKEQYVGSGYEIFVSNGDGLAWKDASGPTDPGLNPLEFGRDGDGQPLYLAQVGLPDNSLAVGKAGPGLTDGAHVGYAGKEEVSQTYKVLCHA